MRQAVCRPQYERLLNYLKVNKDRKNWSAWTDIELVIRFENGDIDYTQAYGKETALAKKIAAAYKTVKPELEAPTVTDIKHVAKFTATTNGEDTGTGFWVSRLIERPSKLLSEDEIPAAPRDANETSKSRDVSKIPATESKKEEEAEQAIEKQITPSSSPSSVGRKRFPTISMSEEDSLENDAPLPAAKKQRVN